MSIYTELQEHALANPLWRVPDTDPTHLAGSGFFRQIDSHRVAGLSINH